MTEHYDVIIVGTGAGGKSNAEAMKGEEPKLTMLAPHWSLADVARHAPTNTTEAAGLYHELRKILNHVGMAQHHVLDKNFYMNMSIPIAGVAHQAGTCRFGDDPATSFFPSIGAVNPALTAMANAIRVGDHLLSRMS